MVHRPPGAAAQGYVGLKMTGSFVLAGEQDRLTVTDAGKDRLRQRQGRTRWDMHHLSPGR